MGYDMRWHEDGDDDEAYFRLNVWAMSAFRDVMLECEMTYDSQPDGRHPGCVCDEEILAEDDGHSMTCHQADERWLRSGVQERPGIAIHKLCSNDGWLVTPLECLGALAQWDKWIANDEPDQVALVIGSMVAEWQEWLAYLRSAAEHGGFRVR